MYDELMKAKETAARIGLGWMPPMCLEALRKDVERRAVSCSLRTDRKSAAYAAIFNMLAMPPTTMSPVARVPLFSA